MCITLYADGQEWPLRNLEALFASDSLLKASVKVTYVFAFVFYVCILKKMYAAMASSRGRGRSRMTWRARLDGYIKDMGLRPEMAMD